MRLRISHSLGVIFLVSACAPTEVSDLTMKGAFHAALASVVDQCPKRDTLRVLEDFNALTGTERDDYETCVGPHGSGTVNLCKKSLDLGWLVHVSVPTSSSLDLVFQR